MSKKRIVHVTSVHPPLDVRIFLKECRTLAQAGYEIILIAPFKKFENAGEIKFIGLPRLQNRFYRLTLRLLQIYKAVKRETVALYHFHDPELLLVASLLRFQGETVIYDVHEDFPRALECRDWIPLFGRKPLVRLFEIFENWNAKRMSLLIAATPSIGKRFSSQGIRVCEVNNFPISDELFRHPGDSFKKENAVCFVGGIDRNRGIREIVLALERVDAKLFLAGTFSSKEERNLLSGLAGWKKVFELGQIDRKEVGSVLARSRAGLVLYHPHPNHIHAQPNKMFEYMSAGLPVIASNFPLWREIIEENNCGLCCDPLKPEEIGKAIQWILEHPEEAKRMGRNGRKAVLEKFNWEIESKKLLSAYETLLS